MIACNRNKPESLTIFLLVWSELHLYGISIADIRRRRQVKREVECSVVAAVVALPRPRLVVVDAEAVAPPHPEGVADHGDLRHLGEAEEPAAAAPPAVGILAGVARGLDGDRGRGGEGVVASAAQGLLAGRGLEVEALDVGDGVLVLGAAEADHAGQQEAPGDAALHVSGRAKCQMISDSESHSHIKCFEGDRIIITLDSF